MAVCMQVTGKRASGAVDRWREELRTYVLSCRTKLEKLLCLKNLPRSSREKSSFFHTVKLHDNAASVRRTMPCVSALVDRH